MVDDDEPLFDNMDDDESIGNEHAHRNIEALDEYLNGIDF